MTGPVGDVQSAAASAGARIVLLNGLGHWWMTQDPERGAAELNHFWETV
jgi:hypothetical protein